MLRYLVLILVILNALFLAWSQGWLQSVVDLQPNSQHEPQRLQQQLHADRMVVVAPSSPTEAPATASSAASLEASGSAADASSASSTASAASAAANAVAPEAQTVCLQAGPFSADDMVQVSATLNSLLPAGGWNTQAVNVTGSWLVYMGPFPEADVHERKLNELRRIQGLAIEEVTAPPRLAQGLSLGRYGSLPQAMGALANLKTRGIRTARIVVERPEAEMQVVRVASAPVGAQAALSGVKLPQGQGFSACGP